MGLNLKENVAKVGRKLIGRQSRIDDNIRVLSTIYDVFIEELDAHPVDKIDFKNYKDLEDRFGCVSSVLSGICNKMRNCSKIKIKTGSSLYKWFDKFLSMLGSGGEFIVGFRQDATGYSRKHINDVLNFFSFRSVGSLKFFSSLNSKEFKKEFDSDTELNKKCKAAETKLSTWLYAAFNKASTVEKDTNANTNQINTSNQRFS